MFNALASGSSFRERCINGYRRTAEYFQGEYLQGEVEILLVASSYRNRDKLWPGEPLSSYADSTYVSIDPN